VPIVRAQKMQSFKIFMSAVLLCEKTRMPRDSGTLCLLKRVFHCPMVAQRKALVNIRNSPFLQKKLDPTPIGKQYT